MESSPTPSISELVGAANETAAAARSVLTAMLLVALSIAGLILATSDLAILRNAADVLPSLGVRVPLKMAYLIAPIILIFLHINTLLLLYVFAWRLHYLNETFDGLIKSDRRKWIGLIHSFSFAQMLGSNELEDSDVTTAAYNIILRTVIWISVVVVPVSVLMMAQVSFVRYQNEIVTYVHQFVLIVEIIVVTWFLKTIGKIKGSSSMLTRVFLVIVFISAIIISLTQAVPPKYPEATFSYSFRGPLAKFNLFDKFVCGDSGGLGCRYINVSNQPLLDLDAKLSVFSDLRLNQDDRGDARSKTAGLKLSERSFRYANFEGGILYGVNFSGSDLRGAWLKSRS